MKQPLGRCVNRAPREPPPLPLLAHPRRVRPTAARGELVSRRACDSTQRRGRPPEIRDSTGAAGGRPARRRSRPAPYHERKRYERERREATGRLPPESVESNLLRYANVEEIDRDEPVVELTPRSVQRVVSMTVERVAGETGTDDWGKMSATISDATTPRTCSSESR